MTMKVVADTNTFVSGFLWDGLPARLLDAGLIPTSFSFSTIDRVEGLGLCLGVKFQKVVHARRG